MIYELSSCVVAKSTPASNNFLSFQNTTGAIPKLVHITNDPTSHARTTLGWILDAWFTPEYGIIVSTYTGGGNITTRFSPVNQTPTVVCTYYMTDSVLEFYKGDSATGNKWDTSTEYIAEIYLSTYIQNGLVFHLDGIQKGSDATKWVDLIGNKEIALENCSFTSNGVDFSESGAIGLLDGTSVGVTPAQGTIEICASAASNIKIMNCCYFRGENSAIRVYESGAASKFDMSNTNTDVSFTHSLSSFTSMTLSMNQQYGYMNGAAMTATTGRTWTTSISSPCIILASSNKTSANRFAGTMHSIRIYNRQLTAEEMLHNQRLDNIRYNLGLSI